jgi:hypothetical protein
LAAIFTARNWRPPVVFHVWFYVPLQGAAYFWLTAPSDGQMKINLAVCEKTAILHPTFSGTTTFMKRLLVFAHF